MFMPYVYVLLSIVCEIPSRTVPNAIFVLRFEKMLTLTVSARTRNFLSFPVVIMPLTVFFLVYLCV